VDTPTRALVIGAHPDDADFGAGGLVALWTSRGCAVTVVCVTDGDSGGFDPDVPRQDVPGLRPEVVVTHAPERNYRFVYLYHPDHLATGAAALAAVYPDARNAFAFPELGLEPWTVPAVWQFGGPVDDLAVDVTDVFEAKVRACSAHDSQTPMLDRSMEAELREDLGRTAREHGLPEGRLAESYRVLDTG
jgi:LmbE family N-acetylglucosaminyl deacetylase